MSAELVLPALSGLSDRSRSLESASAYHQVAPTSDEAYRSGEPSPARPAPTPRKHGVDERWLLARDIQRGGGGQSVEWFFDSIPHAELMKSVARRVVDRHVLHLIKMWLEVPVEETDERGRKKRTTQHRDEKRGIPQGSPLSPLLSNLYMRRFVLGWQRKGFEARLKARIVTYADDLVICCKGSAAQALEAMRSVMTQIKLTVNEEKTRVCRVPNETFDFLGYTFGRCYSPKTGRAYLGTRPSRKSIHRVVERLHAETDLCTGLLDTALIVQRLNWLLKGWAGYFCLGPVSKSYQALDHYTIRRLRRWLCHKHKVHSCGYTRFPDEYFYARLGLVRLRLLPRPWATA